MLPSQSYFCLNPFLEVSNTEFQGCNIDQI